MPEYLVRCVQQHESFRKAELESLATLAGVEMDFLSYSEDTPFAIVTLPSDAAARTIISRSILTMGIYELWGSGTDHSSLHASVTSRTASRWADYAQASFRFSVDAFQGKRGSAAQRELIDGFRYLGFAGPIRMKDAELHLCIFEEYELFVPGEPKRVFLGRRDGYIPPKKPYSFEAMLDDILEFSTEMLVDEGRMSMWMPTANDEDVEIAIPSHPCLQLVSVCVQPFNKWSRRLLTYRRMPDAEVDKSVAWTKRTKEHGSNADELNAFRRKYFQGFKAPEAETSPGATPFPSETATTGANQATEEVSRQLSDLNIKDEDVKQGAKSE
ncbi:putative trna guanosine-2o-methyltransferase trm11 [Diplodia seriata]|uniref:Putative trna guanosine-2o-methyltransferase trm11 n=1 Tax=Diplodia seriata TaxID=420778 RepID=A0A0G2E9I9_9PEZI|nr:putative trna guanosine-2o-methyltransferase trm11 [Diplodia seriata]